ncbi:MAG: IPT/TIG domain-containing protein [Ferruginibacter sp.]
MKLCFTLLTSLLFIQCLLAQIPTITNFLPASGPVGTSVTITGNNFSGTPAANIVYFGAVKAIVTAASSTTLLATVPAGAAFQPITVTSNTLTAFSNKPFNVTFPGAGPEFETGSLAVKIDFNAGKGPACILAADFDGDGKPYLATVNDTSNTLSIFRNISANGNILEFPQKISIREQA